MLAKPLNIKSGSNKDLFTISSGIGSIMSPRQEQKGVKNLLTSPNINLKPKLGHLVTLSDSANFLGHPCNNLGPNENYLTILKGNKELAKSSSNNLAHKLEELVTLSDSGSSLEHPTVKLESSQGNMSNYSINESSSGTPMVNNFCLDQLIEMVTLSRKLRFDADNIKGIGDLGPIEVGYIHIDRFIRYMSQGAVSFELQGNIMYLQEALHKIKYKLAPFMLG